MKIGKNHAATQNVQRGFQKRGHYRLQFHPLLLTIERSGNGDFQTPDAELNIYLGSDSFPVFDFFISNSITI